MAARTLKDVFEAFCSFGAGGGPVAGLEGRMFNKMMRDAALYGKGFTTTDADLIFTAVKPKGAKRIGFEAFETALEKVAAKKHVSVAEVAAAIVATGGPKSSGTVAESCRFFDDKSTWTTTAKAGGPTNYDGQKNLSGLCDRTPADARGISKGGSHFKK
ncbi:p25-alpha family [Chlorella sorokiniana]|uniref:P25-alpha family n=1 Tax=Chlorella sorokiniana TaxID=3076 RepID=A0A2P6TNN1_CHLSO|nr:p25-alpha family [Chlorella sorokiniana]|eukprot:PRW50951.1 p25-alpha family [Chlorella sorokiniana]